MPITKVYLQNANPIERQKYKRYIQRKIEDLAMGMHIELLAGIKKAIKDGDATIIKMLVDRLWPLAQRAEVPWDARDVKTLHGAAEAMVGVMQQVGKAEITIDEGERLIGLIGSRIKATEASEVMERLDRVEAALQSQPGNALTVTRKDADKAGGKPGSTIVKGSGNA